MFPFRKKPPSRAETIKKSVSQAAHSLIDAVPTEKIEETFDELKKTAAIVALQAAQVAHHASEVTAHKLEEWQHSASVLGENATSAAHRASDSAQKASEAAAANAAIKAQAARVAAQVAREALQERAATLKDSAVSLKSSLQERAAHDLAKGQAEALNAKNNASKAAQSAAAGAREKLDAARTKAKSKAAGIAAQTAEQARHADHEIESQAETASKTAKLTGKSSEVEFPRFKSDNIQIEYADSGSKWGWILLGLAIGAALAILFAPTSGRRSRAAIKDRLGKVGDGAVDAVTATSDKVVDIAQRVEGLAYKVEAKLSADGATDDDITIADRVRSVLGHNDIAKSLDRLNIDCVDGTVTLRGPLLDATTEAAIIAAVKSVPGVKDVVNDFLIDESPANPATYAE